MAPQLKRRKPNPKVAEVNFDDDARHEFLTGFSKRKKQRAKHAQEIAEKRAREERIQERKKIREERTAEFKRAMEEHQRQLKRLKEEDDSDGSGSNAGNDGDQDDEWEGFEEPPAVDYEAEYIDEDKYTTVTVEEMDTSREGLLKSVRGEDSEDDSEGEQKTAARAAAETETKPAKSRKAATDKPKKKKKKFRYESKEDRKLARTKQRLSKAKKAQARRER
ncbi:hypothetical protein N7474_003100 [Penicillium riverlandense]|uniref:uncharacterized protein n=1 Tax=Penicillium riverlandense TaxID=1903569 RepID=UPI002547D785|nr:uncharacterized protein N7474_003100 [Penicillium riverlandense]KAJ5825962.1 hypothetical protein N7474_003100 [Penicillium riverlandense]